MADQHNGPYRVTGSRDVYRNPWIHVHEDAVIRPDGSEGIFGVVEMVPGASVLALSDDGDAFLAREYKYGVARETLEVVSGAIDAGESPLQAAQRELHEELGLTARDWLDLGVVDPFTTVVRSPNYLFLARGIEAEGDAVPDPGEVVRVVRLPFARALELVMAGEITHAASCVLILKAARQLGLR